MHQAVLINLLLLLFPELAPIQGDLIVYCVTCSIAIYLCTCAGVSVWLLLGSDIAAVASIVFKHEEGRYWRRVAVRLRQAFLEKLGIHPSINHQLLIE